jgi:glycosyltransferase involved in cell wall biosynthesis
MQGGLKGPRRVLLTLDAVGGVAVYAAQTAAMLAKAGIECRLLGFGPPPSSDLRAIVAETAGLSLIWRDQPLDWMAGDECALAGVTSAIAEIAAAWGADVVHVSAPSQAAGLPPELAVVAQSHSCVPTWWRAVRRRPLPPEWQWHCRMNRRGLLRASVVIVPSASHGRALADVYGFLPHLRVIFNASALPPHVEHSKQEFVFAAGRWWDDAKNANVLDQAAGRAPWPVLMAGATQGPNGSSVTLFNAVALGLLSAQETRSHMARAAIFAAPSIYEPFGLAVLEAAGLGAALVLSELDTFRELWDGAALFVDPADPAAWIHAVSHLAANTDQRSALGERARLRAATYSPERHCRALLSVYAEALQVAGPARHVA